jgi:hypothetical protein
VTQRKPAKAPADPIFSRPYEPKAEAPAATRQEEAPQRSRPRQRQVAALLGGLKRA